MHTAVRYHDICCGHRVVGHEGRCKHLHGHNYRVHFHCRPIPVFHGGLSEVTGANVTEARLDSVGRVIDFSVIKEKLCDWLERWWDHHLLIWEKDPDLSRLQEVDETVRPVPFNPTAENIAQYLVEDLGPAVLEDTGVELFRVVVEETAKCSATYEKEKPR